jgi:hypothetical protein
LALLLRCWRWRPGTWTIDCGARRRHDSIEACLRPTSDGWSLQFPRNGRVMVTRVFQEIRAEAVTVAQACLERVGWNEHW